METGERTVIGPVRKANEDSYCLEPRARLSYELLIVADGMGGSAAGEVASRVAVDVVRQALARWEERGSDGGDARAVEAALRSAVQEANDRVFQMAAHLPEYRGMGTTLTAVLVPLTGGRPALFCHVGDSRAYLLRRGTIRRVTDDHSFVGQMVKNGDLTEAEAMVHPHRNILTKALGTEDRIGVDSGAIEVEPGDVVVLCTDGLSGLVTQDEIGEALKRSDGLQQAVDDLVELAQSRGGHDDITVVAARVGPEEGGR